MSLISDALKEAQRERNERTRRQSGATLADTFFPTPATKPARELHVKPVTAFAAIVAALVVAGVIGVAVARLIAGAVLGGHHAKAPVHAAAPSGGAHPSVALPPSAGRVTPPAVTGARVASARHDSTGAAGTVVKTSRGDVRPSVRQPPVTATAPPSSHARVHDSVPQAPSNTSAAVSAEPPRTASAPVTRLPSRSAAPSSSVPAVGVRVVMDPAGTTPGDSLFAQAYTEHRRGNLDRAAELYERALQAHESSPELYNDYGALLASRGNYTAAIPLYRLGLTADSQNAKLWLNLADAYTAIGRHADALAAYNQLTQLDPLNAVARMRLATQYQAIGDTASARRGFEEAVRLSPKDPTVHYAFGVFLQDQRDIHGAIREYELFVDNAGAEYPQAKVDEIKDHIAALRRFERE